MSQEVSKEIDLALTLSEIIDKKVIQGQEVLRQEKKEEKERQETNLREQEKNVQAEERMVIIGIAENNRSKRMVDESGIREFFSQANLRLTQDYPSAIIEEGWQYGCYDHGDHSPTELKQEMPNSASFHYVVRLLWKYKVGAMGPINREADTYNFTEVFINGHYETLNFNRDLFKESGAFSNYSRSRILSKQEWQNNEEVKKAFIEAIRNPCFHKWTRKYDSLNLSEPFSWGESHGGG